jgi:hypothetical protein
VGPTPPRERIENRSSPLECRTQAPVKVHPTHLMQKMKARSLPELSRMADILKIIPEEPERS